MKPHPTGPWQHYVDWFIFPTLFAVTAILTLDSFTWLAWCASGFVMWTFLEYWTHRVFLHGFYWHANHQRHHTHPHEYVLFPIWYMPLLFFCVFTPLWFFLPGSMVWPLLAGFALGYCWFIVWHHALHHLDLENRPWVQTYANWHNVHHDGHPANYGITVPWWDWVFGTYWSGARGD